MTFKVVLFLTICWICFRIATYPNRVANRHFGNIRWTNEEGDRLVNVQRGVETPRRGEEYLLDMDIVNVERIIRQMFYERGLRECGDTRWYRFLHSLEFKRIEERIPVVRVKEDNPSPIQMEKVVYYENQRVKPPSKPVGEGSKRRKLDLEVMNDKKLDELKGGVKKGRRQVAMSR